MISDSFWNDPKLAHCTSENLFTNLLLLTSRDSNVIGVYRTMWRSIGAGIGWTEAQLLSAARDLAVKGIVVIDEPTGWVWVKNWWDHNSLRAAFLGNVARKARAELNQVPDHWRESIHQWIASYDEDGICMPLQSPFEGASKGPPSPIEGSGGNPTPTPNPNLSSTTTNIVSEQPGGGVEDTDVEALVSAAVWASSKTRKIENEGAFRYAVKTRIQESGPSKEDMKTLAAWRSVQAAAKIRALTLQQSSNHVDELAQQLAREHERLATAFAALGATRQNEIILALDAHLATSSQGAHKLMRKQGLKSPVVRAALMEFMKASAEFNTDLAVN
jgi:hypothetical protein